MALADNLVAYWPCDEASGDLLDAHGANDLTDNNGVSSATGKVGNARDFEVSNSHRFTLADNADVSLGDIDCTICLWFNAESFDTSFPVMLAKDDTSSPEYRLWLSSNTPTWTVWSSGGGMGRTDVAWGSSVSTGTWYFVAVKHDAAANEIGISLNGGSWVTTGHSGGIQNGTCNFVVGNRASFDLNWDGLLDEIGLWKRVLSLAEVQDLYNSGSGRNYAYITGGGGGGGQPASKRRGGVPFMRLGGPTFGYGGMW